MKSVKKCARRISAVIVAVVSACLCAPASAQTSTLKLNTGEVLIGEVLSRENGEVEIKNSFAVIKVPDSAIVSEEIDGEEGAQSPAAELAASKNAAEVGSGTSVAQSAAVNQVEQWSPLFGSETSVIGVDDPVYKYIKKMRDDYREFMEDFMPEGLKIKLRTGISTETTTLSKRAYYFYLSAAKEWETMSFNINGFYNYEWQSNAAGVDTVTTDKYGGTGEYQWNFLGADSGWFFTNIVSSRHDSIKKIDRQFDEYVGVGYEFALPKWGLKWSVSAGPGGRYLEADNYPRHYIPMAFLDERLNWDLTELLRLEHHGYFGYDLENMSEGTAYVMVGLVFAPEEVVSIALRLTNDYDAINSSSAIKNEQKFILSVEIPIEGKH